MAGLVKQLDKIVAENKDKKFAAIVNFTDATEDEVIKFAQHNDVTGVALTITKDGKRFKLNEDAALTVMHYKQKKVAFNHAVKDKIGESDVKAIIEGTSSILE